MSLIDLSQLPVPDVVETLAYEDIFQALLTDLMAAAGDSWTSAMETDPVMKLMEVCAYRELMLRARVNDAVKGCFLSTATGSDLDNLAAFFQVERETVMPADASTGTAAVMESDDALRVRVGLAPSSFSVAGPEEAYEYWARTASTHIVDAKATSPNPGEVVVAVLADSADGTASDDIVAAVQAILSDDDVRPMTDQVTVQSAAIVGFAVAATLPTYSGPDPSVALSAAADGLNTYLASAKKIGVSVTRAGIIAALKVAGIQNVILTEPAEDVAISDTQAGNCTGITLTPGTTVD
ncbi:baseplate assembly protein [Frateuria aurantia]|uniref:Phage-related baseplate assembly protein n=1 Tax=Frateuria aurantia (strain ATCC 33424 / DSM 6220 / KCTC 2777 / LMG 1558 / NBRC 3245 / NCIMB 13370) TaxID=767434 RepID=H8L2K1_FRAAD|nr:baseplate J/gp47 family protein [Frateuria aurantia]AFC85468.1 phage-related baseplate assembly protein [Frateuria aurantia DSM 6220]